MAFHKKYQCHWLIAISKNSQKNIHQIPYLPRDIPDDFDFFRGEIPGFTRPGHTKSELEAMTHLVR